MNRIAIVWKEETVGFMEKPMADMWYLEGKWLSSDSPNAKEFFDTTQSLVTENNIPGGSNLWIELIEEGGKSFSATVISPLNETIFVRQMFNNKSKLKWLKILHKLIGRRT